MCKFCLMFGHSDCLISFYPILKKIFRAVLVVALVVSTVFYFNQEQKECCLCNSFRYHAPCLIDLETGDMIELDLYFPHETKVAELADLQPEQGVFSLIMLGNASGYKNIVQRRIEIEIPLADKTYNPTLCWECRKKRNVFCTDRYALADLYATLDDRENHKLISISDGMSMELRCYAISASKEDGVLKLIIQGNLEKDKGDCKNAYLPKGNAYNLGPLAEEDGFLRSKKTGSVPSYDKTLPPSLPAGKASALRGTRLRL